MRYVTGYRGSEAVRFVRRIRIVGTCWEWTGSRVETGYGHFRPENRTAVRAHVWAWQRINGAVPAGMELDHLCRNRACVRPSHCEPVTHLENMRRGKVASATHCINGHPFSGDNVRFTKRQRVCRQCERERKR